MRLLFLAVAIIAAGCAARPMAPKVGKIAVVQFEVNDRVTAVSKYDAAYSDLGIAVANRIAEILRARERDAIAIGSNDPVEADLVVTGRITRMDGGNRALRALIGFGAGGSTCGVAGEVTRADGTIVGTFSEQQKRKATGYFWARYGESAERQIKACLQSVGTAVAVMVDEGRYRGGEPAQVVPAAAPTAPATTVPPTAVSPTKHGAAQRLSELEALRRDGLVTDEEYQEKRRRIIDEF